MHNCMPHDTIQASKVNATRISKFEIFTGSSISSDIYKQSWQVTADYYSTISKYSSGRIFLYLPSFLCHVTLNFLTF